MEIINRQAQKVVAVAYRRSHGRLLEVPIVRLWLGKFWYFALAVAYKSWSSMEVRLYLGAWRKNGQQK